ncbi:hypothetical protein AB0I91_18720 [Actinosynnema sp. NPDC049800]
MTPVVHIRQLTKVYGKLTAVHRSDVDVRPRRAAVQPQTPPPPGTGAAAGFSQ